MTLYLQGFIFCLLALLAACSGGGSDPTPTYSVSGSVQIQSNINTDSDNNDPFTSSIDNSTFATAQQINNVASINGYVTLVPTGVEGDRFQFENDIYDYYRVPLQAGQVLRLNISNHSNANDLDLRLYDLAQAPVADSLSSTSYEQITVAANGEYFVRVEAYSGASKYVLQLVSTVSSTNAINNRDIHLEDMIPNQAIVKYKPSVTQKLSANRSISGLDYPVTSRPILENFESTASMKRINAMSGGSVLSADDLALSESDYGSFQKLQTLKRIKALAVSGQVEYISPNFMRYVQRVPNDPLYPQQWHYPLINLPQAWEVTTGVPSSGDVIVAVVDTGIYSDHEDLNDKIVDGYDFISDVSNALDNDGIDPNPEDPGDSTTVGESSWHGTHVAGTIAAETNDTTPQGAAGVSWGAKIMPLRVCGLGCSSYDVMQAVSYAAGLENDSGTLPAQAADIINLSLGGFGSSSAEAQLFQQVYSAGIMVVAAAGNEATSQLSYPASYPGVFSVSAVDAAGNLSYYSNFGSAIDIAAPGGDITVDNTGDGNDDGVMSTLVDDTSGSVQSFYDFYQGTSMAAPHVAGVLALMKAVYPSLTAAQINFYLERGDLTIDGDNIRDDFFGYGLIDAFKAVKVANDLAGGAPLPEIVAAKPSRLSLGNALSGMVSIESIGGGTPVFTSTTDSAWITSVNPVSVDAQGMGEYEITVDRTGLRDGFYSGTVVFNFDTAASVTVAVNMTVGNLSEEGVTANLYGVLYNINTSASEYFFRLVPTTDGFSYSVNNVVAGDYYVFVSTDIENDYRLCQSGEVCGIYPATSRIERVTVDSNLSDIDLTLRMLLGSSSSSTSEDANDLMSLELYRNFLVEDFNKKNIEETQLP